MAIAHLHIEIDTSLNAKLNEHLEYGDRKAVFIPIIQMLVNLLESNKDRKRFIIAAIESGFLKFSFRKDVDVTDFKLEEPNGTLS
jgi:hypothetical protein